MRKPLFFSKIAHNGSAKTDSSPIPITVRSPLAEEALMPARPRVNALPVGFPFGWSLAVALSLASALGMSSHPLMAAPPTVSGAQPAGAGATDGAKGNGGSLKAPAPQTIRAFTGARVLMPGSMALMEATIVVTGDTITAAGPGIAIPAGAEVIDLKGKFITPGFIEPVSQLGLVEIGAESPSSDTQTRQEPFMPAFDVADGFNSRSIHIPITRKGGVTSVLVTPQEGVMTGIGHLARLVGNGNASEAQLTQLGTVQYWRLTAGALEAPFVSRSIAWGQLRAALDDAREYGKHKADFDSNRSRALSLPRTSLEALQPVLKGEQTVIVQVHHASDIEAVLRLADTYGLKIVLAGGAEAWLLRDELARRKIPVIMDPNDNLPDDFDSLRVRNDSAMLLQSAGVPVMFSTGSSNNGRQLWHRAGTAVRYGMSYEAALRGLTETPADVFKLTGLGRIAPGAQADLVVWSGMPLEIASQAEMVFIAGQRTSLITRQTLLLERYRTVPPTHPVLPRAEGGR